MGSVELTNLTIELKARTKRFAVRLIALFRALPRAEEARILGRQLLRAGTSVAANYRAACRARSRAEFVAKIGVVVEEADEAVFWMELLTEAKIIEATRLSPLLKEGNELLAIFAASQRTARSGRQGQSLNDPLTQ
ncbi:MAG: four helix bundle protein [Acidobacteria bacterium]|nr:four helix bundle protein [Acidobacteriota bacterium]